MVVSNFYMNSCLNELNFLFIIKIVLLIVDEHSIPKKCLLQNITIKL